MAKHQFHERIKGSLAENEDWWSLIIDDETGAKSVQHAWSYVERGSTVPKSSFGDQVWALDEFLEGDHPGHLKVALRSKLAEIDRS